VDIPARGSLVAPLLPSEGRPRANRPADLEPELPKPNEIASAGKQRNTMLLVAGAAIIVVGFVVALMFKLATSPEAQDAPHAIPPSPAPIQTVVDSKANPRVGNAAAPSAAPPSSVEARQPSTGGTPPNSAPVAAPADVKAPAPPRAVPPAAPPPAGSPAPARRTRKYEPSAI
jgi:hypothetical protein